MSDGALSQATGLCLFRDNRNAVEPMKLCESGEHCKRSFVCRTKVILSDDTGTTAWIMEDAMYYVKLCIGMMTT